MRRGRTGLGLIAGIAFILAAASLVSFAQGRSTVTGGSGRSTDRPLSGTVWASWASYERRPDGRNTNLMVLWRGSPRWFIGPGANRHNSLVGSVGFFDFTRGGVSLRLDFDFDSRTVTVRDERASITEASVVFVDAVNSPGGPVIVDSRRVEAVGQVVADDPIAEVIRRSPDVFEYLQCDDAALGGTMQEMCDQVRPALR